MIVFLIVSHSTYIHSFHYCQRNTTQQKKMESATASKTFSQKLTRPNWLPIKSYQNVDDSIKFDKFFNTSKTPTDSDTRELSQIFSSLGIDQKRSVNFQDNCKCTWNKKFI